MSIITQTHLKEECQLVNVSCPSDGCSEEITRSQLDDHLQQCQYRGGQSFTEEEHFDQQKVLHNHKHTSVLLELYKHVGTQHEIYWRFEKSK